jgi:hypothetical protein
MATTGVVAEASSQSRRWTLETSPGRVGAGVSLDSRIGNDGLAGVCPPVWIGMVGWLRIMAFSRTGTAGRSRGFKSGEWDGRTLQTVLGTADRRARLQPGDQASITLTG